MSREIKFRVYDKTKGYYVAIRDNDCFDIRQTARVIVELTYLGHEFILEQYTGLKDKNGKEIYENCELDGRYRVEYIAPRFVGKDMIKGDIIELYENRFTITKEHCEISQNS